MTKLNSHVPIRNEMRDLDSKTELTKTGGLVLSRRLGDSVARCVKSCGGISGVGLGGEGGGTNCGEVCVNGVTDKFVRETTRGWWVLRKESAVGDILTTYFKTTTVTSMELPFPGQTTIK